jgi:hypothetical protein
MQYWHPAARLADVRDNTLEAAIDLALGIPHGSCHLRQRFRKLGLALHDQYAVGEEAEIFAHRLELLLQFRGIFGRQRHKPRRRSCALIHWRLPLVIVCRQAGSFTAATS